MELQPTRYWHELPQEEVDQVLNSELTFGEIEGKYKPPIWCNYGPDVLHPLWGCWSLTDNQPNGLRTCISETYCKNCEMFKK